MSAVSAGPQAKKPNPRWTKFVKTARWLGVLYLIKFAVTAALYGVTRIVDIEEHVLNDSTRDSVRANSGGKFVKLRDGFTHYEVAGPDTGHLIVLAAGSSVPGYIWTPTFDSLRAAGFRVMRYDYFGRGWSDRPRIPLTQEVYVHQLAGLLDSLQVKTPITLAGLSYGGTVITSFAAMHPAKVGALIYMNPAIRTPSPVPWYLKLDIVGDLVFQWQARKWAEGQLGDFLHPEKFPDWPERYKPQMTYKGFRRGRLSDREANAEFDARIPLVEVGKHDRPVLVVWGKQDRVVPFTMSEPLLKALPKARLVPIDSAAHLPHWEQPGPTHAALISFLRENRVTPQASRQGVDR